MSFILICWSSDVIMFKWRTRIQSLEVFLIDFFLMLLNAEVLYMWHKNAWIIHRYITPHTSSLHTANGSGLVDMCLAQVVLLLNDCKDSSGDGTSRINRTEYKNIEVSLLYFNETVTNRFKYSIIHVLPVPNMLTISTSASKLKCLTCT